MKLSLVVRNMVATLAVVAVAAASPAQAGNRAKAAPVDGAGKARPRIGLVLSGGGALGAAHVGVLKVLEELRVPIDVIAGTSMGAVVGGLYASGVNAAELERHIIDIDWNDLFIDASPREDRPFRRKQDDYNFLTGAKLGLKDGEVQLPTGLIQGHKLALKLRELTLASGGLQDFDRLPIPFRAIAADVETGKEVILGSGDLATAMRASMSVPGVFPPVDLDGKLLVDGGVTNNLPMDVARAMGADILIVADLPTALKRRDKLTSTFAIAGQMLSVLIQQNSQLQLKTLGSRDVYLLPDLGDMSSSDFLRMREAVKQGEAAARTQTAALSRLSLSPAQYAAERVAHQQKAPAAEPVIAFVEVENHTRLSDRLITATLGVAIGEPLDRAKLEAGLRKLYGHGEFERIDYRVIERDRRAGLVVAATEKGWAKNYVNFGLALSDNLKGDTAYNLATSFTLTGLNDLGAEWRNEVQIGEEPKVRSEFYQPVTPLRDVFVAGQALYSSRNVTSNSSMGEGLYRVSVAQGMLASGAILDTWGEARAGYRGGTGWVRLKSGVAPQSNYDFNTGEAFVRLSVDTLDNVKFPKDGASSYIELTDAESVLGASSPYRTGVFSGNIATNWERNTFVFGGRAATSVDDKLPPEARFSLGGLFNLSGLSRDRLSGQNLVLGRAIYYRTLTEAAPGMMDVPLYVGVSAETGNVWERKSDVSLNSLRYAGSLFVGADTYIGPLYLAVGRANRGETALYLFLGRTF